MAVASLAFTQPASADCTCADLENYVKEVEKKRDVYSKLSSEGKHFNTKPELDAEVGKRMGWDSVVSIGKGGLAATPTEVKTAREACIAQRCDWICDIAIDGFHESYHSWYQKDTLLVTVIARGLLDAAGSTRQRFLDDRMIEEAGAHDAEAKFLHDTIDESVKNGKCKRVEGSPDRPEMKKRFEEAHERVDKFLKTAK